MQREAELTNRLKSFLNRYYDNHEKPITVMDESGMNKKIGELENDLNTPPKKKTAIISKSTEKPYENTEKYEKTIVKSEKILKNQVKSPKNDNVTVKINENSEKRSIFENFLEKRAEQVKSRNEKTKKNSNSAKKAPKNMMNRITSI